MAQTSAEKELKDRIITHMNRDHPHQLSHILRRYASLPLSSTLPPSSCTLTELDLHQGMLIRCPSGTGHRIPFDPPKLSSWDDVQDRITAMDATARAALDISDVLITESPTFGALSCLLITGVLLFVGCAATLPYMTPGGAARTTIDAFFPGGFAMYRWVVKAITWPVLAIHVGEALAFERFRMRRHGVERWSALWWMWEINVLVQGIGAWRNIDAFVDQKRRKQNGSKRE